MSFVTVHLKREQFMLIYNLVKDISELKPSWKGSVEITFVLDTDTVKIAAILNEYLEDKLPDAV